MVSSSGGDRSSDADFLARSEARVAAMEGYWASVSMAEDRIGAVRGVGSGSEDYASEMALAAIVVSFDLSAADDAAPGPQDAGADHAPALGAASDDVVTTDAAPAPKSEGVPPPAYGDSEGEPPVNADGTPYMGPVRLTGDAVRFDDEGNLMPGAAAFRTYDASGVMHTPEMHAYWTTQAQAREPLIGAGVPTAVRDTALASTVQLSTSLDANPPVFSSGGLARVQIDGEERVVLLTVAHAFGVARPFYGNGATHEITEYTFVARGPGGQVVIPTDDTRVAFDGRSLERDALAVVLPPDVAAALRGTTDLSTLPRLNVGQPAVDSAQYAFGFPTFTAPTFDSGRPSPADTRLLVGTELSVRDVGEDRPIGAVADVTERNPPMGPGSSGGPVFIVGPNGEVMLQSMIAGVAAEPSGVYLHSEYADDPRLRLVNPEPPRRPRGRNAEEIE